MAQFKVGGKVVCLVTGSVNIKPTNEKIPFKEGEVKVVTEIFECACGVVSLSFGQKGNWKPGRHFFDCECGVKTKADTLFVKSKYFVPLEEKEFEKVTYTKILDEIPACAQ